MSEKIIYTLMTNEAKLFGQKKKILENYFDMAGGYNI